MKSIAIFASGAGSNAARIIEYAAEHSAFRVALIVCNKVDAGVVQIAVAKNIPLYLIDKNTYQNQPQKLIEVLNSYAIDLMVLAGFLWLIPIELIRAFPDKIINLHPSLLPAYGGKGMYGSKVHQAVLAAGESESGISIHKVNEVYDQGEILFQVKCQIDESESVESLQQKIHALEHEFFPKVIDDLLNG